MWEKLSGASDNLHSGLFMFHVGLQFWPFSSRYICGNQSFVGFAHGLAMRDEAAMEVDYRQVNYPQADRRQVDRGSAPGRVPPSRLPPSRLSPGRAESAANRQIDCTQGSLLPGRLPPGNSATGFISARATGPSARGHRSLWLFASLDTCCPDRGAPWTGSRAYRPNIEGALRDQPV